MSVRKGKLVVNGKSSLGLLTLSVTWKAKLIFKAEGEDAEIAIRKIKNYFQDPRNCLEDSPQRRER
ncbi:MAG: HPr family phosphocarrier protein [bacterium]